MMERSDRMPSLAVNKPIQPAQETGNFDFRLQFHASRVPRSGWDKLVVSMISVETGKATIKTSRGLVRNGSCQWPDPIIESTSITQDPASQNYNKKLYKLMVQMGSLRVGILGEATINLTDYINSYSPDTISLPLKKCPAGTVLHVKIECLTPKAGSGELESAQDNSSDEEFSRSASDSDKESYSSEDLTLGSVRSFASQSTNGRSTLSNSQRQFKDEPLYITTSRQDSYASSYGSSSYSEVRKEASNRDYQTLNAVLPRRVGSTASEDMMYSQDSIKSNYASNHNGGSSATKGWQDAYAWQSECTNPNTPSSQNGSRFISNLPQKLDAAEATIKELREEALTWERHSHKLNVEAETLKQQLATELKSGAELRVRISSLESENDTLRSERGQRRAPNKRGDVESYIRLELDKSKQLVTALEEENIYEKEVSANLRVQVQKTQDSNNELVSVVTELEAALELRNKEISRLDELNEELKEKLDKMQASACATPENSCANLRVQLQKTQDSNNELVSVVTELEVALELRNKEISRLDELNQELKEKLDKMQASNVELLRRVVESEVIAPAGLKADTEIGMKTGVKLNQPVQNEAKDELCEVIEMLKKEMKAQNMECEELTGENIVLFHKLRKANRELDANVKLITVLEASLEGLLKFEEPGKLFKQLSSNKLTMKQDFIDDDLKVPSEQQLLQASVGFDDSLFKRDEVIHNDSDGNDIVMVEKMEAAGAHDLGGDLIEMNIKQNLYLEADNAKLKEKSRKFFQTMESLVQALQMHKANTDSSLQFPYTEVSEMSNQQNGCSAELSEIYEHTKSCKVFEKRLTADVSECCFDIEKLVQELAEYTAWEKKLHMQLVETKAEIVSLDTELQTSMKQKRHYQSCLNELALQVPVLLEEIKLLQVFKVEHQSSKLQVESEKAGLQEKLDKAHDESRAATERLNELEVQMAALMATKTTLERRALELQSEKEGLKTQVVHLKQENSQLLERIVVFEAELKHVLEERESKVDVKTMDLQEQTESRELNEEMGANELKSKQDKQDDLLRQGLDDELNEGVDDKLHTELIRDLQQQLLEAVTECSSLKEKGCSLEGEIAELLRERGLQEQCLQAEITSVCRAKDEFEQRANKAEESMHQLRMENAAAILLLQSDLQGLTEKVTSMSDAKAKLAVEATELCTENVELKAHFKNVQTKLTETEEELYALQERLRSDEAERQEASKGLLEMMMEMSELKQQKTALEEKLSNYKQLMEAQEAAKTHEGEQRNELRRLKRHVSQCQRKLVDQEEEKVEFQSRIDSLEEKLVLKTEALSRTEKQLKEMETSVGGVRSLERISSRGGLLFSSRESKELLELRQNSKLLEEYVKSREEELISCKIEFMERETELCDRIEKLELSNEQLAAGLMDPGTDQLKKELLRLQIQNSSLSRKEQELISSTQMQEVLQEEVFRLQEDNEVLEARLAKFMETVKNPFLLEKIVNLETELAEALEANNMYRMQLKGILDKQQNVNMASLDLDELEQMRTDLSQYKKRAAELEEELCDMNERYANVSLRLAETETKRGELLITLRNLRNAKST